MRLPIERKNVKVLPDVKRVIARYFFNGEDRAKEVIKKVMESFAAAIESIVALHGNQAVDLKSPLLSDSTEVISLSTSFIMLSTLFSSAESCSSEDGSDILPSIRSSLAQEVKVSAIAETKTIASW